MLIRRVHEVESQAANVGVEQQIDRQMIAVGIHYIFQGSGVNYTHTDRFQMVLHGEEVPDTSHEFQAGQIRKIHTVHMV